MAAVEAPAGYALGDTLRTARQARGMTQRDVATALGVKQASVQLWESGATKPQPDRLPRLAETLHLPYELLRDVVLGQPSQFSPEVEGLAMRLEAVDGRMRRAVSAMLDAYLAGGE